MYKKESKFKIASIFLNMGRYKTLLLLSVTTIFMSEILTYLLTNYFFPIFNLWANPRISYWIALIIPLLSVPLIGQPILLLLYKINDMEKEMRRLATFDELTGVYTRRAFFEQVEKAFVKGFQNPPPCILILDIDRFKKINDTYGHSIGDCVLKNLGEILESVYGEHGVVGRIGGEEFAIFLYGNRRVTIEALNRELSNALNEKQVIHLNQVISYTISIGGVDIGAKTWNHYYTKADQYLYTAKNTGRNKMVYVNQNGKLIVEMILK